MLSQNPQELAHALFEYIKQVCQLAKKSVMDIALQEGKVPMSYLDDTNCIKRYSRDTIEGTPEWENNRLLTFHKPDFTSCPTPPADLEKWLVPTWTDYKKPTEYLEKKEPTVSSEETASEVLPGGQLRMTEANAADGTQISIHDIQEKEQPTELFTDNPIRVAQYEQWAFKREKWIEHEKHTARLRHTFNELFDMYNQFRQAQDTLEIMVGNGLLTDKENSGIRHPLFLKRITLELDSVENTIHVSDTSEPAQMYISLFSEMADVSIDVIRPLEKRAEEHNIHPLDHSEGADLLKSVAHQLHASSRYIGDGEVCERVDERIVVRWEPYIFLRKRPDDTIRALEAILSDVDKGAEIPLSLSGIIGAYESSIPESEGSDSDKPAFGVWAEPNQIPLEDEDILLPKSANREQIQIVKQIERSPAVLVQGPPGTGKTHTIANLLGHFLAQGKTVLVTSHTSKALKVLKEKVPRNIQALCVAKLDDSPADMEESVNVILEHVSMCNYSAQMQKVERIRQQRHQTLLDLKTARDLVYTIRHKEFEPIIYNGESFSPSKAAEYVAQRESLMDLIPGPVSKGTPLPLSMEALEWLYGSNGLISAYEENELAAHLPTVDDLLSPQMFADGLDMLEKLNLQLQELNASRNVRLIWKSNQYAVINQLTDQVYVQHGDTTAESDFRASLSVYDDIPQWAVFAAADGCENGLARKRWEQLLILIEETYAKSQSVLEAQLEKPIRIISDAAGLRSIYNDLLEDARKHGRVKKGLFMKKEKKDALSAVSIAGKTPELLDDVKAVCAFLEVADLRERLGQLWDSLLSSHGAMRFAEMGEEPERICHQQIKDIRFWINWAHESRVSLCKQAERAGIGEELLQPLSAFVSFSDATATKMFDHITKNLLTALNLLHLVNELYAFVRRQESTLDILTKAEDSVICQKLQNAVHGRSASQYETEIAALSSMLQKEEICARRSHYLDKLSMSAPKWAEAVQSREGIHGESTLPDNLLTAWKVHQLSASVAEITQTSLSDAEHQVTILTAQFRSETEKLASAMAWCCLQKRIEGNTRIQQALNGWKQTISKIGKGTGKHAPALRAEARKLMVESQKAVPAWIMPVSTVMNTIDPASTKFDIIIVDEASQSDITASAILYMGRKIIIVGDDEQVSPLSVGLDETKLQNLMDMFIRGKIPNAHLWDAKTSLYDIAAQVYRPLMLREHFRCVPDIIGYSNMLSYQGKIKPLREAGSASFQTATVPFRVHGMRKGRSKINEEEADAIVALIRACLERKEYADKTIGVISMLGDEQVKLIRNKLAEGISLADYEKHHILCGNASNFQGDERDVIFLSLIDSNESTGPLPMASGEGQGSNGRPMKQRYNVAVSRARDQVWVVHSLDYTADLKPGDMRRRLLEYVADPHAVSVYSQAIDEASDSPFEAEVAKALAAQGYHIEQQKQVGSYFIDMVAVCGKKEIAIECDGERWHSGEEKIREDMERQALLERLGWRFIRIRGSEYFRNPSEAIARVVSKLNQAGIQPEVSSQPEDSGQEDVLLSHVKERAMQLLSERAGTESIAPKKAVSSANKKPRPARPSKTQDAKPVQISLFASDDDFSEVLQKYNL